MGCGCGNKVSCRQFAISDKVRFVHTDFFKEHYGHHNFVKSGLRDNEVFNVVAVFEYEGDQFLIVKNQLGDLRIGPWSTNFFIRVS